MRSTRALIAGLTVVLAMIVAISGGVELALFALPFAALVALLVSGRYVGEEHIHALRRTPSLPRRKRAARPRWQRQCPVPTRSLFARAPRTFRGPPALHLS